MAADSLDSNPQVHAVLLAIRTQLREAHQSGQFGRWQASVEFRPHQFHELEAGTQYKTRLTLPGGKA